jgi:glycosyltransferase involved in cell wall biosynthesis
MKLGIVALEFPPAIGGMPNLAAGLARSLVDLCEVSVWARRVDHAYNEPFPVRAYLSGKIDDDLQYLREQEVDAWLLMNSGYSPLIPGLGRPCFVYCHGNDFLRPFVMRRHYLELAPRLAKHRLTHPFVSLTRRVLVRRDVGRGLRQAHAVFANSSTTVKRLIAAHRPSPEKLHVVNPGVDDQYFQDRIEREDDHFQILTVTRLSKGNRRKNVDTTLRAMARLADLPARYVVVGDGNDRPRLEALAHELGIDAKVEFTGAIGRESLLKYYRESDLFVLVPRQSRFDVEGFGIVYIEATASGVPVLGTSYRGGTDAIQEGVNGFVLRSADVKSIEVGIRRVWQARHVFSPQAMRSFAEQFRWPRVAERVHSLITRILAQ